MMTTVNILKSFVGIGIMAAPYGFKVAGFFYATLIILFNGFFNAYTACL
jgi:amino acid permease